MDCATPLGIAIHYEPNFLTAPANKAVGTSGLPMNEKRSRLTRQRFFPPNGEMSKQIATFSSGIFHRRQCHSAPTLHQRQGSKNIRDWTVHANGNSIGTRGSRNSKRERLARSPLVQCVNFPHEAITNDNRIHLDCRHRHVSGIAL